MTRVFLITMPLWYSEAVLTTNDDLDKYKVLQEYLIQRWDTIKDAKYVSIQVDIHEVDIKLFTKEELYMLDEI